VENNELILNMIYALIYLAFTGLIAYAGKHAAAQVKALALELVPYLRRVFDPNTVLSRWLISKGYDPAQVDRYAEIMADALQKALEAVPLAERDDAP
jgi:hypothetical protein